MGIPKEHLVATVPRFLPCGWAPHPVPQVDGLSPSFTNFFTYARAGGSFEKDRLSLSACRAAYSLALRGVKREETHKQVIYTHQSVYEA